MWRSQKISQLDTIAIWHYLYWPRTFEFSRFYQGCAGIYPGLFLISIHPEAVGRRVYASWNVYKSKTNVLSTFENSCFIAPSGVHECLIRFCPWARFIFKINRHLCDCRRFEHVHRSTKNDNSNSLEYSKH